MIGSLYGRGCIFSLVLVGLMQFSLVGYAQEFEPNEPCANAQLESAFALPVSIFGSLDSADSLLDVDFFRFTATPAASVEVDLEGVFTNGGTLGDPYLGLFDADCALLAIDDDGGVGLNSKLSLEVPASGEFVLGVTQCCDSEFTGGGIGSYTLSLNPAFFAGSVYGVLRDAESGDSLPGDAPPFAFVQLNRCNGSDCSQFTASMSVDGAGGFSFSSDHSGAPLVAGTYRIQAYAQGYPPFETESFDLAESEHLDLGDLNLPPLQTIGSVSGRLIDGIDGSPLSGSIPPYAFAVLARCEQFGCYGIVSSNPDETGAFHFSGGIHLAPVGEYIVIGYADGYQSAESARVTIGKDEDLDLGDIELIPYPIQFGGTNDCEIVAGQVCRYGVEISARVAKRFKGEAWSIVQFIPTSVAGPAPSFQVGRLGVKNPMPEPVNLKTGQTRQLWFELKIPHNVPDGFLVCASVAIGSVPDPQFNVVAERPLFCAVRAADTLRLMSEKESRSALRKHRLNQ